MLRSGKRHDRFDSKLVVVDMEPREKRLGLRRLVFKGKEQDFLSYRGIIDHVVDYAPDAEQLDTAVNLIHKIGIDAVDQLADAEMLLSSELASGADFATAKQGGC